jgi:uroporphyrinogen-III synthase
MSGLEGCNVLLTRTQEDSAAWAGPLSEAGAAVTQLPCIRTEINDDEATRDALNHALFAADWLVLTSRRGVDAVCALVPDSAISPRTRIAVVGAATAAAASAKLGRVDCVGASGTAAGLGDEIAGHAQFRRGQRCVAPLAANAGPALENRLIAAGADCIRIDVYRTIPEPPAAERQSLAALDVDAIVFSSPTTVTGFLNQVDIDCAYRAFSIGPSTSAALRRAQLTIAGEAGEPSIAGIVNVIRDTLTAPTISAGEDAL